MKKCNKCQKENTDNANFCERCGAKVNSNYKNNDRYRVSFIGEVQVTKIE